MSISRVLSAVAVTGLLVGCGSDASESTIDSSGPSPTTTPSTESSSAGTTAPIEETSTTAASESSSPTSATDPPAESTTTIDSTTTTESTNTTAVPSTRAPDPGPIDVSIPIPTGDFIAVAPGDAIVLGADGDLELRPRLIGTVDDPAVPLVDAGPGSNVIDDVAGFANGSLIYGDCCEPASGNIYALTAAGTEPALLAGGYNPDLSPDGQRLVTANNMAISVTAVDDGSGVSLPLNQGDDDRFFDVADVQWTTDGEFALLSRTRDGELLLTEFDADSLTETNSVPIGQEFADLEPADVNFAGFSPGDTFAVSIRGDAETAVRFFEPGSLTRSDEARTLPPSVSSVHFVPGNLGLTWVDDSTLYFLPEGQFEPNALATDVLAAWPLESGPVS